MRKGLRIPYQHFEETLRLLLERAKTEPISLETMAAHLAGRGRLLLLVVLSLGFGQIPGTAFFLGLIICYMGFRIALGKNFILLPKFLLHKKLPAFFINRILGQMLPLLKWMRKWTYPRAFLLSHHPATPLISGLMIALVGISFMLSPPIPFTGWIAVITIFALSIGLLNDDGVYIAIGVASSLFYFALILFLMQYFSLGKIIEWVREI